MIVRLASVMASMRRSTLRLIGEAGADAEHRQQADAPQGRR